MDSDDLNSEAEAERQQEEEDAAAAQTDGLVNMGDDDEENESTILASTLLNFSKHVIRVGSGSFPKYEAMVRVHYVAWLRDGMLKVDSSRDRGTGEPVSFQLGKGDVLEGVDKIVATMQAGEICHAVLPPNKAYGEDGWPPHVPPNATIEMDLELMDFTPIEELREKALAEQEAKAARLNGREVDIEELIEKAEPLKAEGNALFKQGQHMAAAKKYRDGIRCFEKRKGLCTLTGDDMERAKVVLVPLHSNLAQCHLRLEDWPMAAKNSKRVLELDEANVKARFRCATAMYEQDMNEEAAAVLASVQSSDRDREIRELQTKISQRLKKQYSREKSVYGKMF